MWAAQARDVPLVLVSGLDDGTHRLVLTLTEEGELTIGGFVVTRDLPFLWPVGLLTCGGALLIFLAVWTATADGLADPSTRSSPAWKPLRRASSHKALAHSAEASASAFGFASTPASLRCCSVIGAGAWVSGS